MALLPSSSLITLLHISSQRYLPSSFHSSITLASSFKPLTISKQHLSHRSCNSKLLAFSYRYFIEEEEEDNEDEDDDENHTFDEAVALFNGGEYYKCHDYLESLWNNAEEPTSTLIHGILQCAVGFYHLFNQNHRGAMMELGEGLCKLRKMEFSNGPFHKFEKDISAVLDFIYQTQIELAACSEDVCVTMDRSERSYRLLGEYASGKRVYDLELCSDASVYIVFCPQGSNGSSEAPRVKLPKLKATMEHLVAYEYK
ncbi:hypothetical protein LR48_Vigan03g205700 [Vigna angularis]|uniref:DUF309 domain-containing protein n=2 Tax=Phaseolus angularis TaxID=3914 RepID=A0A0L9U799_PHAAN|nr:uncharacterized protein LOC108328427 [Vigna angularis]KAG2405473.1 uncharacterized protein HKW66_Vig0047280 [Vigna angularis]KOM38675.1 hypothetical protein LR48_Vigan03g205700 [Vigna angularis]BAT85049.1 hypothetical protein VIGAN_04254100 [Vigna angularis var. angularis]